MLLVGRLAFVGGCKLCSCEVRTAQTYIHEHGRIYIYILIVTFARRLLARDDVDCDNDNGTATLVVVASITKSRQPPQRRTAGTACAYDIIRSNRQHARNRRVDCAVHARHCGVLHLCVRYTVHNTQDRELSRARNSSMPGIRPHTRNGEPKTTCDGHFSCICRCAARPTGIPLRAQHQQPVQSLACVFVCVGDRYAHTHTHIQVRWRRLCALTASSTSVGCVCVHVH